MTIIGTGNLTITDLHSNLSADLSNISIDNADAKWSGSASGNNPFQGSLYSSPSANRKVSITTGNSLTLKISAERANGQYIIGNNSNTIVSITDLGSNNGKTANLSNISSIVIFQDSSNNGSSSSITTFTGSFKTGYNIDINNNVYISISAAIASNKTIIGNGNLTITNLEDTLGATLENISVLNSNIQWTNNTSNPFTGSLYSNKVSTRKLTISGKTLKTTAAIITGQFIESSGTLSVTDLASTLGCDFSNISCSTLFTDSNNDGTFTGTFKSGVTYTINSGVDLVSTATILNNNTITDSGNLTITDLDSQNDAILSNINVTGTVLVQHSSSSDFTFSGRFPKSSLTFSGGQTVTVTSSNAFETGKTFTISNNNTISANANVVSGKTISGSGTLNVTKLNEDTDVDFSNIDSTTFTAEYLTGTNTMNSAKLGSAAITVTAGTMTIGTADTGNSSFTISSGAILNSDANKISGKTISGQGTLNVTKLNEDTDADFSNITSNTFTAEYLSGNNTMNSAKLGSATITVTAGTMTIGTANTGTATFNIVSGATIVTTAEKIKTRTVNGAGNITITSIDAGNKDQDLSSISATGTVLVQHSSSNNFTFSGRFPKSALTFSGGQIVTVTNSNAFETGKAFTVSASNTISSDASVVSGKTITGSGTLSVTKLNEDTDADFSI